MDYLVGRMLCSFLSGAILSQSGSFIQLSTRNILSSPSTLGIDGLAILWLISFHSLAIIFDLQQTALGLVIGLPVFIFIGFLFTKILNKSVKFEKVILLGLTFNLLVGAIFSLWQFFFLAFNLPFPVEVWFGHFRQIPHLALTCLFVMEFLLISGFLILRKDILIFSLGPTLSRNLRLNEKRLFTYLFMASILGAYVVISFFGAFSFLGLIFPILARKFWFKKFDISGEILAGSLMNGLFLMVVDLICYFFPIMGAEVPVGLIVTAVGAVSLILILWLSKDRAEFLANGKK